MADQNVSAPERASEPAHLFLPGTDYPTAYAALLRAFQSMCSHDTLIIEGAGGASPEVTPNPTAVTRDSGLLAFSVHQNYECPTGAGWKICRGDTIVVNMNEVGGLGDTLLVSDGSEFTLVRCLANGSVVSLSDPDYMVGSNALFIGTVVEGRKPARMALVA